MRPSVVAPNMIGATPDGRAHELITFGLEWRASHDPRKTRKREIIRLRKGVQGGSVHDREWNCLHK